MMLRKSGSCQRHCIEVWSKGGFEEKEAVWDGESAGAVLQPYRQRAENG